MERLGINAGYLVMQIFGILILLMLMRAFAYDPILRVLDARKARIAKGLEDARQAAIARDNADAEAKKILDAARAEAAKIRSDATVNAEQAAGAVKASAADEAKAIVAAARTEAEIERNRILGDMRSQVASISIAAANKLVGAALDETRQRSLVADFFSKVPADVARLTGETAIVTSAMPLTDAEKKNAQKAINAKSVDFKVDPAILGGLIVRVGDQVVDNSVANQMGAMRDTLLA